MYVERKSSILCGHILQKEWKAVTDAPYPFLSARRSIRSYRPEPVPKEAVERILSAVTLAPTAHHLVHWHVAAIVRKELQITLAQAMANAWAVDLAAAGVPLERRTLLKERSVHRLSHGPVQILLSVNTQGLPGGESKAAQGEDSMAVQSVAAATFAILLAASSEGLGAAWHCPPLYCPDVVRTVLGLPHHLRPQAIVTLGYAADTPPMRPGRSLGENLTWFE